MKASTGLSQNCNAYAAANGLSRLLGTGQPGSGKEKDRSVCRDRLREVLHTGKGPAGNLAGRLLPDATGRLLQTRGSRHGIAWRRADSLSMHEFSGCADQDRAGLFDSLAHTAADHSGNESRSVMRDYSRSSNTQRVVQIEGTQNCGHRFTTASRATSPRSTSLPACMSTIQQSARSIRRLRIALARAVIITGVPHGTPQPRDSSDVHRRRSNS